MPKADSVSLYRMRRVLRDLAEKKGRGTELVSLYIPPKKPIHEVMGTLREEYGTASNIKSDTTRNHVQEALMRTMQRLKLYHQTPENGLAIFCGALPTNGPGSESIMLYEVIPPKPIQTYLYRCDDHFHLEPLQEMVKEERLIGIIAIDSTEAGLGMIAGNRLEILEVVTSGVSGKHRAGGQSARRFERLREMELIEYFNRVAEHAKKVFLEERVVEALLVSGPGHTKNEFVKGGYLDYRLQRKITAVIDSSYAGREGVREALERAGEALQDVRLMEERRLIQRFLKEVHGRGLAVYGLKAVLEALQRGSADVVLVSEELGMLHLKVICKQCGHKKERYVSKEEYVETKQRLLGEPCTKCGQSNYDSEDQDIVELLAELAELSGARVEVISSKSEEGAILKSFEGIAALLRYR